MRSVNFPQRSVISLNILLSVASFEQYENDLRGFVLPLQLSEEQFYSLLNLLGPCLEDHPHYHVQLRNDDAQFIYLCFDIVEG